MPIIPNLNIIFIHIPKTGGSSINEYFNLAKLREQNSIQGNFICEQRLPGSITSEYGKNFVWTSQDLRPYLSKGDFIRVGNLLYQVHAKKPLRPKRIHLASIDCAGKIMKGNIAETDGIFIGNAGKSNIYKKLVSDHKGSRLIPSKFHWGWLTTHSKSGQPYIQVFDNARIRQSGNPAIELDHVSIRYIKSRLPENVYQQMFSFCFIRNPYSRLVSEYFWKRKDGDIRLGIDCRVMTFGQFIKTLERKFNNLLAQPQAEVSHYLPQYLFVCDENEEIMVDYVAKYEDGLENGLATALEKIGLIIPNLKLPKSNSTSSSRQHFSYYYTPETQEIVYRLYEKDFKIFGYDKDLIVK